jgi:hypothetical protein
VRDRVPKNINKSIENQGAEEKEENLGKFMNL